MIVKDILIKKTGFTDKISPNAEIKEVISVMSENKKTRTVFVTDDQNNLLGIITIKELFDHIFDKMKPKIFFKKNAKITKASDLMRDAISVSWSDSLEDALRVAKAGNLQDIPVCDKGKIIGEIDGFELLQYFIEQK